jgi:hypothetical protein
MTVARTVSGDVCIVSGCPYLGVICPVSFEMKPCPKLDGTLFDRLKKRHSELGITDMAEYTGVESRLVNPDEYPRYENPDGTHFPMNPRYKDIPVRILRKKTSGEMLRDIKEKVEEN